MGKLIRLLAALAVFAPMGAHAESHSVHSVHSVESVESVKSVESVPSIPSADQDQEAPMSDGTVRKVDLQSGKVTLRHGPIDNIGMPPMTMVFRAKNPEALKGLKAGDEVRFRAESVGGAYFVTEIRKAP